MRLMCSQDQTEIDKVKEELFKAGIIAESRNHPIAEALGVPGLELWVQDERDFFNASKLYARLQDRSSGKSQRASAYAESDATALYIDFRQPEAGTAKRANREAKGQPRQALEQASSLLEKEIEEMLQRESGLAAECASLRTKTKELGQALAEEQAALAREAECRAAVEKKEAEQVSSLQSAVESERANRKSAEERLGREQQEWQQQLKSRQDLLIAAQKELDSKSQLLQTQQAAMAKLKDEIASLELQWEEDEKSLCKAREEASKEREARISAEQRAERAAEALKSLEKQLHDQQALQQKMQAHVASINSLCSRLHSKRAAMVEQNR